MKKKILLVDDHKMVIDGLKNLIAKNSQYEIIGQAFNGQSAVKLAIQLKPDVVVMDINMPLLSGIDATRKILETFSEIKIVILSMHSEKVFITEALRAGARGFVLKDSAFDELMQAIQSVVTGTIYLSASIADMVVEDYLLKIGEEKTQNFSILSPREREVLHLLADGQGTKEIASALLVSVKTVETHRQQLMKKLNLYSIAELTKYAIREGLTNL